MMFRMYHGGIEPATFGVRQFPPIPILVLAEKVSGLGFFKEKKKTKVWFIFWEKFFAFFWLNEMKNNGERIWVFFYFLFLKCHRFIYNSIFTRVK